MRRILIQLFAVVIIVACNNDNKTNTQNEKGGQNDDKVSKDDRDDSNNKGGDPKSKSQYNWTEREQNKFLEDCRRESEENVNKGKLKDFCSCMLTQVQKYYPSYSQMDEKSDEDHDKEILAQCLGEYGEDEN